MVVNKAFLLLLIGVLFFSCANPGIPSGGERDLAPPVVLKTIPENYSTQFNKSRIVIDFSEFVKLNDISKNFMISPPQKRKPKVLLKGKQIVVELRDSLKSNTTYTLDFGTAIVDNNEGNPLGEYRFVFSTGSAIDSLGLAGYVHFAETGEAALGATVALYQDSALSTPLDSLPSFLSVSDSAGFFMVNNIPDRNYRILAFQDENNNSKYDEGELIAFSDSLISPRITPSAINDTVQLDPHTLFGVLDIDLQLFRDPVRNQYLTDYGRTQRKKLHFTFNTERTDTLSIDLLDLDEGENWYLKETFAGRDSLFYWITDSTIANRDTLLAQLSYLRTDSLQNLIPYTDTVKLNFRDRQRNTRRREQETTKHLSIQTNVSGKFDSFTPFLLNFETPLLTDLETKIKLARWVDSTEMVQEFSIVPDSITPTRSFALRHDWQPDAKYVLSIDSAQLKDLNDLTNDSFSQTFETYDLEFYGKIIVHINSSSDLLIQLLTTDRESKIVRQQELRESDLVMFDKLPAGTYRLKAVFDSNKNKQWDTGDYLKQQQPERVRFFKKEIKLRSTHEQHVQWNIN